MLLPLLTRRIAGFSESAARIDYSFAGGLSYGRRPDRRSGADGEVALLFDLNYAAADG